MRELIAYVLLWFNPLQTETEFSHLIEFQDTLESGSLSKWQNLQSIQSEKRGEIQREIVPIHIRGNYDHRLLSDSGVELCLSVKGLFGAKALHSVLAKIDGNAHRVLRLFAHRGLRHFRGAISHFANFLSQRTIRVILLKVCFFLVQVQQ
jgi:hypothetical protein